MSRRAIRKQHAKCSTARILRQSAPKAPPLCIQLRTSILWIHPASVVHITRLEPPAFRHVCGGRRRPAGAGIRV